MRKRIIWQTAVILAVVATIVVNGLANALPINGLTTGEISDRFDVFFVPAGYVFSIWGVIYLGLIAFAVYQALPAQRVNPRLADIAPLFLLSSAANIAWIFLWHYEQFVWTLPVMVLLLLSLIGIYVRLGIGETAVSTAERWLVRLPFSIYLGWITVATIANATSLLEFLNWNGWGIAPQTWAVIMLGVALIVAALMAVTRRDWAYLAVLVWAFAGIGVKHADTAVVATAAWTATGVVAALLLLSVWWRGQQTLPLASPA